MQIISNRFVDIARRNKNRFTSAKEFTDASIYNYKTTTVSYYTEMYTFNEVPRKEKNQIRKELRAMGKDPDDYLDDHLELKELEQYTNKK